MDVKYPNWPAARTEKPCEISEDFSCSATAVTAGGDLGLECNWKDSHPTPKQLGRMGEQMARLFLDSHGYQVVAMNWRCHAGEADIVAIDQRDGSTALVEVKSRVSKMGEKTLFPERAVNRQKQNRYQRIALTWLALHPRTECVRFDVVALNIYAPLHAKVRLMPGAFEWDD